MSTASATPGSHRRLPAARKAPTAAKDGCYLHSWSASYRQVTKDLVIRAIWEYETTVGIDYESTEDSNYCIISGCFPDLQGDVYLGAYHDGKKVLGVKDGAFQGCDGITNISMLDGTISIGKEAFADCTALESIVLPDTLVKLGEGAFRGCTSLKSITLPESLITIDKNTFSGCTSLEEVIIPEGIKEIGNGAFSGCSALEEIVLPKSLVKLSEGVFDTEALTVYFMISEQDAPEGFSPLWNGGATVVWDYTPPEAEEVVTEEDGKKDRWPKS